MGVDRTLRQGHSGLARGPNGRQAIADFTHQERVPLIVMAFSRRHSFEVDPIGVPCLSSIKGRLVSREESMRWQDELAVALLGSIAGWARAPVQAQGHG